MLQIIDAVIAADQRSVNRNHAGTRINTGTFCTVNRHSATALLRHVTPKWIRQLYLIQLLDKCLFDAESIQLIFS